MGNSIIGTSANIIGTITPGTGIVGSLTVIASDVHQHSFYEGETTITPSAIEQVLPTANALLLEDITIAPIPSNYGLITYSGSVLTVS